jgi:predicted small secreted protein
LSDRAQTVKKLSFMFAVQITTGLSGCNAMAGLGKDVEKGGEMIQKGASR